jgi:hypothetical protein
MDTTTFAAYAEAEQHITQHSGDGTYRLPELTAAHGEDEHEIRLDPTNRVIWWAYDSAPIGGDGWTVQRLNPAAAARDADAQADLAEDRIEADDYEHESTTFEQDQDLLDEYAAILALSVAAEPQAAREDIGYSLKALYRHGWRA